MGESGATEDPRLTRGGTCGALQRQMVLLHICSTSVLTLVYLVCSKVLHVETYTVEPYLTVIFPDVLILYWIKGRTSFRASCYFVSIY